MQRKRPSQEELEKAYQELLEWKKDKVYVMRNVGGETIGVYVDRSELSSAQKPEAKKEEDSKEKESK